MQTSDPDTRLMLAFRDGDTAALSELYRHWAGPLLRFLERMVREKSIAEELMQETFIRVHGARDRYVPEARFSTWLFRIGRNLALNELERVRSRAPHLTTDESPREPGATRRAPLVLVATQSAVDDLVDARREHARLENELATLPERQRSALWLTAVEGYSYDEVAEVLETTSASVKALVHRARSSLVDRMTEKIADASGKSEASEGKS